MYLPTLVPYCHYVVNWRREEEAIKYYNSHGVPHNPGDSRKIDLSRKYEDCECVGTIGVSVQDTGVGMTEENLKELFHEGKWLKFNLHDGARRDRGSGGCGSGSSM